MSAALIHRPILATLHAAKRKAPFCGCGEESASFKHLRQIESTAGASILRVFRCLVLSFVRECRSADQKAPRRLHSQQINEWCFACAWLIMLHAESY